ncbi:MAG: GNAT family N-acetyltransferase [Smithellaceae bacterium]
MLIRQIHKSELAELLQLYALLHPDDPPLDPRSERVSSLWQEIQSHPHIKYYVAEIEGKIVSTCTLTIIPNLTRAARPYGVIENVFTLSDFRKQGIATAVLRKALAESWNAGCYKVMLLTGSKKEETLHFYEKAGFQRGVKTGFISYPDEI